MEIIVGKTAGFCYGVQRAVNGSIEQIENNKTQKIYCLGELVHNKQVILKLEEKGINFIEDLNEVKEKKSKVIIRAHGIPKEIYESASIDNIDIADYTCPNVLKIHKIAEQYAVKGYYIILCGKKNHPENIGTISYCGKNFSIIENENEIEEVIAKFRSTNIKKLLIISQTTYSFEKFEVIQEKIKKSLQKGIDFVVNNTICKATELRQKETEEISKNVDCMLIIGGKNSSNTTKLYEIARKNCKNTFHIETEEEIEINNFKKYNLIGIMAGASTPKESINKVLRKMEKNECMASF